MGPHLNRAYSPYEGLPPRAFWRTGVAEQDAAAIADLYRPKFPIARDARIAVAGTCFAPHVMHALAANGFAAIDAEPAPHGFDQDTAGRFGYGLGAARWGSIGTPRQLLQLCEEALGAFTPADAIWEEDGRYFDALRPTLEPEGLASPTEVDEHRAHHLRKAREVLAAADVWVIVLGLTEAWRHRASGTVYPSAPGTVAGAFDSAIHAFHNFSFAEIHADLAAFMTLARRERPGTKFILMLSPIPLTATASGEHVLTATTQSKSILRAAAGQLAAEHDDVDYFPLYEIACSPAARGAFFEANRRTPNAEGIRAAVRPFLAAHGGEAVPRRAAKAGRRRAAKSAACDAVIETMFAE